MLVWFKPKTAELIKSCHVIFQVIIDILDMNKFYYNIIFPITKEGIYCIYYCDWKKFYSNLLILVFLDIYMFPFMQIKLTTQFYLSVIDLRSM